MKKKTIRTILLVVMVPVVLVIMAFLFISLYYSDHFYPGTWINGVNFSNKTVEEAKQALIEYKSSYTIRVVEADGDQQVILGADIDYAESFDGVENVKTEQGMWHWYKEMHDVEFHTVESQISFNEEKLKTQVMALDCVNGVGVLKPQDAYVTFDEDGVHLFEEVGGTLVDGEKLFDSVKDALVKRERRVYVEDEDCYVPPKITTQSPEIREIMEPVEAFTKTVITYTFDDKTEVLDETILKTWIVKDEEGNISINQEKLEAFVYDMAERYNTWGEPREFVTTAGDTITVEGGNYGWSLDKPAEIELLTQQISEGAVVTREPVYNATAHHHGGNEIGDTYIEISIGDQHMWFYKDGELLVDTNVVTGNVGNGYYTPVGSYKVLRKLTDIVLEGEERDGTPYESPVDYWIGFLGRGYGIHDASWRGNSQGAYGGSIYKWNGSHGCVNTPYSWVQQIYNEVEINTPVLIY